MRALTFVTTVAAALLAVSPPARACRCLGPDPGAEALDRADVAVVGEVLRVSDTEHGPESFVLRVVQTFRGPPAEEVTIRMGVTSCSFRDVHVGDEWLVFARRVDGALTTRKCTGTVRLREAGGERSRRAERWLRATARAAARLER